MVEGANRTLNGGSRLPTVKHDHAYVLACGI